MVIVVSDIVLQWMHKKINFMTSKHRKSSSTATHNVMRITRVWQNENVQRNEEGGERVCVCIVNIVWYYSMHVVVATLVKYIFCRFIFQSEICNSFGAFARVGSTFGSSGTAWKNNEDDNNKQILSPRWPPPCATFSHACTMFTASFMLICVNKKIRMFLYLGRHHSAEDCHAMLRVCWESHAVRYGMCITMMTRRCISFACNL